jgi:hypothetical protein
MLINRRSKRGMSPALSISVATATIIASQGLPPAGVPSLQWDDFAVDPIEKSK